MVNLSVFLILLSGQVKSNSLFKYLIYGYAIISIIIASQEDVETLVRLATKHDIAIIPYGGGTSVTWALLCPKNEKRMIVSLDTSQLVRT